MRSLTNVDRAVPLSSTSLAILGLACFATLARAQTTFDERDPNSVATESVSASHAVAADKVPAGLIATDWSSIRAAYESNRHAVFAVGNGHQARNPGQQWLTSFDDRGFTTEPDTGGWSWGLELVRYGFARVEQDVTTPSGMSADGQRVTRRWNSALDEWYVNDARGLEHGFTVHERPSSGEGPLMLTLAVRGELEPHVQDGGRGVRFVNADGASVLTYSGLTVFDADGHALAARLECVAEGLRFSVDECGARYPLEIDPTAQQAYLKASNTGMVDTFGYSVSVAGDTVVVGAPTEDSNATGVNGDQSNNSASSAGAAYIFVRSGTTWSQQAYLKASNTKAGDEFGVSVSVSGNTVVVGAISEDSNATGVNGDQSDTSATDAGAAYVFVRSGTSWSQQAYLKASNTGLGDWFGYSVSVSDNTVVVGARLEASNAIGVNGNQSDDSTSDAGAAYVFTRSGTTWSQQAYLKASNTGANDRFGFWVEVSGDTVVVGAVGEDSNATVVNGDQSDNSASSAGAAYIFVRSGTTWSQQAYLKASNTKAGDEFGVSVSVSGNTVVVGAISEDSNATGVNGDQSDTSATDAGAAYVFVRSGTSWSQQAYLKASNTQAGDEFGVSVSASGNSVVVGAISEDSNATGVDSSQSDNSATDAGAAYVFVRSGTSWSQQAYLKASNTGANDFFGHAVTVSGDTVVVAAVSEDSNATGVDGSQSDNSATGAGAAYVFRLDPPSNSFCFGDGSLSTDCPCSLPKTVPVPPAAPGRGCANSQNLGGALLSATGTTAPDTVMFSVFVSQIYVGFGLMLKGNAEASGGIASGDGIRCVDGQVIRVGSHYAATFGAPQGYWTYPNTVQTNPVSVQTVQPSGQTAYYQLYYRNTFSNFCTAETTNWSNGVQVVWP